MTTNEFKNVLEKIISQSPIRTKLERDSAVVLERIARGGGATSWYYCSGVNDLEIILSKLHPGSIVSFYFDNRIQQKEFTAEVRGMIEEIILKTEDAIIGTLMDDSISIFVDIVTRSSELTEFASSIPSGKRVFFGAFPARDNDGNRAVTLTLPDADGVMRCHPH